LRYQIEHICQIIGGEFLRSGDQEPVEYLLIDSRRLLYPTSTLFFALSGKRRNGMLFLIELYARGLRNFVVFERMDMDAFPEANFIYVKDSLKALQDLAAFHRSRFDFPVIGITGSNGKTIVKEWLFQLLEPDFSIVRSPRSYNSQIGVPLSVWQINEQHNLAIFEAGISRIGEMERLELIILPDIGVFTNIGEAHSEGFGDNEEKIAEKLRLFSGSKVLICPADSGMLWEKVQAFAIDKNIQLLGWGFTKGAGLRLESSNKIGKNTHIKLDYGGQAFGLDFPFTDESSLENALNALCVLLYLRIPVDRIQSRIPLLSRVAMRLELKSGINNCSVINDSYSADLNSLRVALDFMLQQQQYGKRTVLLSDFLQTGREEGELYQEIASMLVQKRIDRIIGIGERIKTHQSAFLLIDERNFFSSVEEFKIHFPTLHFRDETILLKGARIYELETIERLLSEQIHRTLMEIDLNAMASNLRQFQQLLKPGTRLMAMVKAFSYGGGSFEIANLLQFHKVDYLAVAYADEGIDLRKSGIRLPIMVMNPEAGTFDAMVQYQLEPVIYSFHLLEVFDRFLKKEALLSFPVHIELETGMNRLGFSIEENGNLGAALKKSAFKVQSIFSHLAASEEAAQDDFTRQQAERYLKAAALIENELGYPFLRHIANTAGILRHPALQLDMVRLGIGLYGIGNGEPVGLKLQEVSTLKSTIAQIKKVKKGETVGYNRKGVALSDCSTATVSIGFADGYSRSLGNGMGKMLVNGRLAPVIGSVCMDMTMIDITGIPDVREGDEAIVFGKELSVRKVAAWAGTIPYEMLTGISQRVKRIYFEE
jgi:alanine racemase